MTVTIDYLSWRKKHGFTQSQAGKLISRSHSTWSLLENGKAFLPASEEAIIQKLLQHFDDRSLTQIVEVAKHLDPNQVLSFRKRKCLSQEAAGDLIGCSSSQWGMMENGRPCSFRYALSVACLMHEESDSASTPKKSRSENFSYKWPGLEAFEAIVSKHGGNRSAIADELGISRAAVYAWLEKYPHLKHVNIRNHSEVSERQETTNQSNVDEDYISDQSAQIIPYYFEGQKINVVQSDEILMTYRQLGEALGYARPHDSISQIIAAHFDEIGQHLTSIDLMDVSGVKKSVSAIRERGITLVTGFSQQPKAKIFRQYAADVIFRERRKENRNQSGDMMAQFAQLIGLKFDQTEMQMKAYADQRIQQERDVIVSAIEAKNYVTFEQAKQISDGAAKRVLAEANKWAKDFEKEENRCAELRYNQLVSAGITGVSVSDILKKEIRTPIRERVFPLHGLGRYDKLARTKYTEADREIAHEELGKFKRNHNLNGWDVLEGGQA